ncbi:hypothetical protein LJD21_25050 [Pseudomonas inefficax]|uniref:hypothetical protein n=1 Tax=Pseudomonas inefficax TaxID=2078786 RepID=UPI00207B9938|nr:hypothetical protein [Pseudomonas inefficax]MCM8915445.1 hypothetical protein [Pseudomonas inefficax]
MPLLPNQLTQESWLPLLSSKDISVLMRYFGGFSDSIVVTYECRGDTHVDDESYIVYPMGGPQADQSIIITFQRQSAEKFSVQLLLKGVIEFSMRGRSENFDGIINAVTVETSSSTNCNLVARPSIDGPAIIASRAATICWRPTPA